MIQRHTLRADSPAGARELCALNNSCAVHSQMSCVDEDRNYRGAWSLTLWDDLILSRTDGIGLKYQRQAAHIQADDNDSVFLHFNLGPGMIGGRQLGRDYALAPGAGGVFVHNEPVNVGLYDGASLLGLALPRMATRRWQQAPEDVAARVVNTDGFAFGLLIDYLEALTRSPTLTPGAGAVARSHMADLAGLWLGGLKAEDAGTRLPETRQHVRITAIRRYIRHHFADNRLTVATASSALGMSERLMQQVLQADGTSFSRLLSNERLRVAAQTLINPDRRATSITELAFACGFNDLSTFYKAFAAHFSEPPGHYRLRHFAENNDQSPSQARSTSRPMRK